MPLLVGACGGGSGNPGVAHLKSTTTSRSSSSSNSGANVFPGGAIPEGGGSGKQGVEFSVCIRSHGIPNYPDPGPTFLKFVSRIDVTSPRFVAAAEKCLKHIPGFSVPSPNPQAADKAASRAVGFAACMRRHAIADFPDPQVINGRSITRIQSDNHPDLDPNSPLLKHAAKTCQSVDPGELSSILGPSDGS